MFLNLPPTRIFSEPWTLESRESRLVNACRGKTRVAYYYDFPDGSTVRYRVHNMIRVLATFDPDVSVTWFCREDMPHLGNIVASLDVLIICRARYTASLNEMISRARHAGCAVIYDVDDLVFDQDFVHLLARTLGLDFDADSVCDFWFGYVGRIGAAMRLCDRTITTNDYLAERIRKWSGGEVRVVPNFLNEEQLDFSREIIDAKRASNYARDGTILLGYFSGTPSHNRDFALIEPALIRIMTGDRRLRLRVGGYLSLGPAFAPLADRIEQLPMQNHVNLQRFIGETEFNLSPLQNNVFTNCKSELKFFEAGIVGTNTIASPIFSFRQAIVEGVNGRLSRAQEWDDKLLAAIADLDGSGEAYRVMAERAFATCEVAYSWRHQRDVIRASLFSP